MSVSLYQTGVSGLLASQQQLATTGHNIANVNTEGYTVQRTEQNATQGITSGKNYLGTGTYIQDITRLYDQFSYKEQLMTQSSLGNADTLNEHLTQLDHVMSTSGDAVVSSIESFYLAVNSVADNPSDAGLRSIVLNQANVLSNNFTELNDNLNSMTKSVNSEIEQVTNKISEISLQIASINENVMQSLGASGSGQSNDLLDQRNQLISELSEYTSVNTLEDSNGVTTVMIGQGITLVAGITPLTLEVNAGDPDATKTEISLVSGSHSVGINSAKLGGSLGASIEFRDEHLDQTRLEIDRLAMAISSTLNESQASGLDLNGLQGANFFTDINTTQLQQGRVLIPTTNTGTTQAEVTINDVSLVTTDELEIRFDGTDFTLYNLTSGVSENLGPQSTGSPAVTHTPTSPDYGFSFVESGGAVAGDTFTIIPTKNSAALMETTLTNGNGIAASSASAVTASSNNVSDGSVTITNVTDPVNARAANITVDVYESSTGVFTYDVYNIGPPTSTIETGTYNSGETKSVDTLAGFTIEISGELIGSGASAPESFTIGDAFGVGNGNNAVTMAKTQEEGVINGGSETFSQSINSSTSVVGAKASTASSSVDTAQALYTQAYNRNQEASGVNLDEEAANLLKYQQAYQAASQIITTANTIFDSILSALR